MINEQEFVINVKRRLSSYTYLIKQINKWEDEILKRDAQINGVPSGSPKALPEGNNNDIDWRSDLFYEIEQFQKLIDINQTLIDWIHRFVKCLDKEDREIIDKLYLRNEPRTYTELCGEYKYSREGLRDRVNRVIVKHWKY